MIDLHCHSNCSDGSDAPGHLAHLADQSGLEAIALTDHDTLGGLDEFMDQQPRVSARLIPGIELSCQYLGRDLHVLGLFVSHRDDIFKKRVLALRLRRYHRNLQIFEKLKNLNINVCQEDYFEDGQKYVGVLTRAHIAQILIETGRVATKAEAFQTYLGEDGLAYAPFEFLSPAEAFKWILEAKGLPIIAHPARFGRGNFIWDGAMAELQGAGAMGIEAYYSEHSDGETKYFLALCNTLGMAPAGGSDYHGRFKPGCKLGTGWGDLCVPAQVLNKLLDLLPA